MENTLFKDNLISLKKKKKKRKGGTEQSKLCPRHSEIFGRRKAPKFQLLPEFKAQSNSTKDEKLMKIASSMLQETRRHLKDGRQGGVKVDENKREA